MMRDLCAAYQSGALAEDVPLFNYVADVASNLLRQRNGYRFSESTKSVMAALLAMGGPKCSNVIAWNLHGPKESTVKQFMALHKVHLVPGVVKDNFEKLAAIFSTVKSKLGLSADYPLPYFFAEDETAILAMIEYCARLNAFVGIAGKRSPTGEKTHQPLDDYSVHIEPEALRGYYQGILDLCDDNIIGSYLRIIVIGPLHAGFPMLPLVVQCTNNTFIKNHVMIQWKAVYALAAEFFFDVFRTLPLGNASDGDQRRSTLQLFLMLNTASKRNPLLPATDSELREFSVNWVGLRLRGLQHADGTVTGLHMQDYTHNIKKAFCGSVSLSRSLVIGDGVASHEHVWAAVKYMHDLQLTDLLKLNLNLDTMRHYDKQNFATVLRISSRCVQDLLHEHYGLTKTPGSLSTALYLDFIWRIMMVFTSKKFTVEERINLCGYCISFVALWMNDLETRKIDVTKASAFLTIQSCRDIILSLNTVVLVAAYFQEMNVRLTANGKDPWDFNIIQRFSSDVLERLFSRIGGFGEIQSNKRNFTFLDALCKIKDHIFLLVQESTEGIHVHRRHHKFGESDLLRDQEPAGRDDADGTAIPDRARIVLALQAGFMEAVQALQSAGVPCVGTQEAIFGLLYNRMAGKSSTMDLDALLSDTTDEPNLDEPDRWPAHEGGGPAGDLDIVLEVVADAACVTTDAVAIEVDASTETVHVAGVNLHPDASQLDALHVSDDSDQQAIGTPDEDDAHELGRAAPRAHDAALAVLASEGSPFADAEGAASDVQEGDDAALYEAHLDIRAEVNTLADLADLADPIDLADAPVVASAIGERGRRSKDSFHVLVPFTREPMHIHRLMAFLNKCVEKKKKLSKDRISRISMAALAESEFALCSLAVRRGAHAAAAVADVGDNAILTEVPGFIGLGSDLAFLFRTEKSGKTTVRFWLGQVHRIVQRGGSKPKSLTSSIPLSSIVDGTITDVFVQCYWYKPCSDDYRSCRQYSFIKGAVELAAVPAQTALCEIVDLSLDPASATHSHVLSAAGLEQINERFMQVAGELNVDPEATASHPVQSKRRKTTKQPDGKRSRRGHTDKR